MRLWFIDENIISGKLILATAGELFDTYWNVEVYDAGYTYNIVHVYPTYSIKVRRLFKVRTFDLKEFIQKVEPTARRKLIVELSSRKFVLDLATSREHVIKLYRKILSKLQVTDPELCAKYIFVLLYLAPYAPLLLVPNITDIFIRENSNVIVESTHPLIGRALSTWRVDEDFVNITLDILASRVGVTATMFNPVLSVTDCDLNVRISVVTFDVAGYRTFMHIRVLPRRAWLPTELVKLGTVDAETIATLGWAMSNKIPVIPFGETGSGKTTLLTAIAQYLPLNSVIAIIQDVREIRLVGEQLRVICELNVRHSYAAGIREVSWQELFMQALRLKPDFVLIPEVRGPEIRYLFEMLLTGHGGGSTIHADSPESVIQRLKVWLRELNVDLTQVKVPIILVKMCRTIAENPPITVRKVEGVWILQEGELIEAGRHSKIDLYTIEDVVVRYASRLTLKSVEELREERAKYVNATLSALENVNDEQDWILTLLQLHRR